MASAASAGSGPVERPGALVGEFDATELVAETPEVLPAAWRRTARFGRGRVYVALGLDAEDGGDGPP